MTDWKVFLNQNNHVYLIASDYVPNNKMPTGASTWGSYTVFGSSRDGFVTCLQTPGNWTSFKNSYADSVTGGASLAQFWASYNGKYGTNYSGEKQSLSSHQGGNDALYFLKKENVESMGVTISKYWLTSPDSSNTMNVLSAHYGGSVSGMMAIHASGYTGVRPLVCLSSNVKMTWNGAQWTLSN